MELGNNVTWKYYATCGYAPSNELANQIPLAAQMMWLKLDLVCARKWEDQFGFIYPRIHLLDFSNLILISSESGVIRPYSIQKTVDVGNDSAIASIQLLYSTPTM